MLIEKSIHVIFYFTGAERSIKKHRSKQAFESGSPVVKYQLLLPIKHRVRLTLKRGFEVILPIISPLI